MELKNTLTDLLTPEANEKLDEFLALIADPTPEAEAKVKELLQTVEPEVEQASDAAEKIYVLRVRKTRKGKTHGKA